MSTKTVTRRGVYPETIQLIVWECPSCGIVYGIPVSFANACQASGQSHYCPNGHSLSWRKTDTDRQRERADAAVKRAAQAENAARYQREQRETAERSARAYKGHLTRMRNRIVNGVYPVPGCQRSGFLNVMRHVAAKHPEWHHEHSDELGAGFGKDTTPLTSSE